MACYPTFHIVFLLP